MDQAGEAVKLPITESWRARFKEAYDALPQGEKQRVADFAGCSGSLLSRISAGEGGSSEHLSRISEYLKIAPPAVLVGSLLQARLAEEATGLDDEDIEMLRAQIRRLKR